MDNKICHLTTVHHRYDIRIFKKMCKSLTKKYQYVHLVVADGKGDEMKEGVYIHDIGKSSGRLNRMTKMSKLLFKKALWLNADIYHFHDPELIPIGRKLLKENKVVVMDAHEDFPKQLRGKPYMNWISKFVLSSFFLLYEVWACRKFNAIVAATTSIAEKFKRINDKVVVINNFPIINELSPVELKIRNSHNVCYIGAISEIRGIRELITALEFTESLDKLLVAGAFNDRRLEAEVKRTKGWNKVESLGVIDRNGVKEVLGLSAAGLVTFLAQANHIDAQPNKMFEYMSAGIPVISSNFPLWREIIEESNCGICVDPASPHEIADAIDFIITHPLEARKMGENGYRSVRTKYNWTIEEKKMFELYNYLEISVIKGKD